MDIRRHLLRPGLRHDHGDVVGGAADERQANERRTGVARREFLEEQPDLLIGHLPRQAVAAEEVHIPLLDRVRPFDVDLDAGMRAHRAGDDVLPHRPFGLFARQPPLAFEFPHGGVVAGELIEGRAAEPVGTAVADVADEHAARHDDEGRAGRPHAEIFRLPAAAEIDLAVGLFEAAEERQRGGTLGILLIDQRHLFGGDFACPFPGDMGSHPVGDEEQPAARLILLRAHRGHHRQGILVVGAAATDVGLLAVHEGGAGSHA